MAEIQLLGMTHYPPFAWSDDSMSGLMHMILSDPGIPVEEKEPANWHQPMRAKWRSDGGKSTAPRHRQELIAGLDRIRTELESFQPDVILIWAMISTTTSTKGGTHGSQRNRHTHASISSSLYGTDARAL